MGNLTLLEISTDGYKSNERQNEIVTLNIDFLQLPTWDGVTDIDLLGEAWNK